MTPAADDVQRLRAEIATLTQLLEVQERVALEAAARLEREGTLLRELFLQAPAAIAMIEGDDLVITFGNEQFLQVVGNRECVGKPVREAFPELEGQGYFEMLETVRQTGVPQSAREAKVLLDRAGRGELEETFFNFVYQPFDTHAGDTGIITYAVEVTELVQSRTRLEAIVQDLSLLADAAVAMNEALSVDGIASVAAERACDVVGAREAVVELAGEEGEDARQAARASRPAGTGDDDELEAPFIGRDGRVVGRICLRGKEGGFAQSDYAALVQLAQMAGLAIENARLYEREHRTAEILQRSLLPEIPPSVPGIEAAVRYLPGGAGTQVGGDWYDQIQLPDGRFLFALGDVGGRGVPAASMMGQIRMAVRAHAFAGDEPPLVLQRVDRLLQALDQGQMVTLGYLVFDPAARTCSYTSAGHPPPVMVTADGHARLVEVEPSVPLGVVTHPVFSEHRFELEQGATVLLYSDGLVERRGESLDDGLARLRGLCERAPSSLDGLCDFLIEELVPEQPTDDVALLAFRPVPLATAPLTVSVPAEPRSVATIRRALMRWLDEIEAEPGDAFDIVVSCGEACSNAVEHAYGPSHGVIEVEARCDGGEVLLRVRDFGRWRPPRGHHRGRGLGLMRALMGDVEVDATDDGTVVTMRRGIRQGALR